MTNDTQTATKKYRAPALEKGLDILELLSKMEMPVTSNEIASLLGRSKPEFYRMLHVLETRGYVERLDDDDSFIVTNKLLALGTERQPIASLYEFGLPIMRALSAKTNQSCHLAIQSDTDLVVVARAEAPGSISYTVRVGYKRPFLETASGRLIFARVDENTQAQILRNSNSIKSDTMLMSLEKDVKIIQKQGYWSAKSAYVKGVTDLSAPIEHNGLAIAALTIPFIHIIGTEPSKKHALQQLIKAAKRITASLTDGHVKPL